MNIRAKEVGLKGLTEKDNDDYKDQQAKDGLDMISAERNRYEVRNRGA